MTEAKHSSYADSILDFDQTFQRLRVLLDRKGEDGKDYNSHDSKFVAEMIKHHEMAVDMADKEIEKGKSEEIISMAKAIRKAQASEINQMRKWLKSRGIAASDSGGSMGMG